MKEFDRYSKEFYLKTEGFTLEKVLTYYQLLNSNDLHNMICGYKSLESFSDSKLYDVANSIDYFEYEKELWNLRKPK